MSDLTPEQQAEVQALHAALASEFAVSEEKKDSQAAKTDLVDLKPEMLKALKRTLEHGTVDQASRVAMWGYGELLKEAKAETDPIRALIEGMPAPATTKVENDVEEGEITATAEARAVDIPVEILESTEPDDVDTAE